MYFSRTACICSVVTLLLFSAAPCFAQGEWPDGPHKEWFENLRHAANGQPYLFMLAGTIQCFVRPKGGL
jgi:hypothetical protein